MAAYEPLAGTSQAKRSFTLKCNWCKEFGHNKRHVREVQSRVAEEAAFHLAEAWVFHLTKEADLLVEGVALHLADEALYLGEAEAEAEKTVHLIFQVGQTEELLHLGETKDIPSGRGRGSSGRGISPGNV
ncbi:unnamed protein product [Camellia sinensis]